jgi:hypothetical protein
LLVMVVLVVFVILVERREWVCRCESKGVVENEPCRGRVIERTARSMYARGTRTLKRRGNGKRKQTGECTGTSWRVGLWVHSTLVDSDRSSGVGSVMRDCS